MKINIIKYTAIALLAFVFTAASASAALNLVTAKNIFDNKRAKVTTDGGTTWTQDANITDPAVTGEWSIDTRDNMIEGYSFGDTSGAPVMRITLATGLTAGYNYTVHAYFYHVDIATWGIALGGGPTGLTTYTRHSATRLGELSQAARDAKWVGYNGFNGYADDYDSLALYETDATVMTADASGNLYAYVGRTAAASRTVIQGLAYEFHSVPELETYALIFGAFSFGFVMLRRRFKA